jgi:hypothetical protein
MPSPTLSAPATLCPLVWAQTLPFPGSLPRSPSSEVMGYFLGPFLRVLMINVLFHQLSSELLFYILRAWHALHLINKNNPR